MKLTSLLLKSLTGLAIALSVATSPAVADVIDKPTLAFSLNPGSSDAPDNPFLLIFGVPVENLLFNFGIGGATNGPLSLANIVDLHGDPGTQALLYQAGTFPWGAGPEPPSDPLDVSFTAAPAYLPGFTQGALFDANSSPNEVYRFLGVGAGTNNSHHFASYQQADVDVPMAFVPCEAFFNVRAVLRRRRPPGKNYSSNLRVLDYGSLSLNRQLIFKPMTWYGWTLRTFQSVRSSYPMDAGPRQRKFALGAQRTAVHNQTKINQCIAGGGQPGSRPTGTFDTYSVSIGESGLIMPQPCLDCPGGEVPEPTSMLLLGTGLLRRKAS
jgi:hypothetical protein